MFPSRFFKDDIVLRRPSRLLDQHFGSGINFEDLLPPVVPSVYYLMMPHYLRPWRSNMSRNDQGSTIIFHDNKFQVNLDVQQFAPEEITVKVSNEYIIVVEGKHEEKQDEHGYISRHFQRRYVLPKGHDIKKVTSNLSSDGILTITAPKLEEIENNYRQIPITQTGTSTKLVSNKPKKNNSVTVAVAKLAGAAVAKPAGATAAKSVAATATKSVAATAAKCAAATVTNSSAAPAVAAKSATVTVTKSVAATATKSVAAAASNSSVAAAAANSSVAAAIDNSSTAVAAKSAAAADDNSSAANSATAAAANPTAAAAANPTAAAATNSADATNSAATTNSAAIE